jgi:hypothetical protein
MSTGADKLKHSKRLLKDDNAIHKQLQIAKSIGHEKYIKEPHRLVKHHAMNCGNPKCVMCANPRKVFGEKTIQEQRFDQTSGWQESDD